MADLFVVNKKMKENSLNYRLSDDIFKMENAIKLHLIDKNIKKISNEEAIHFDYKNNPYSINEYFFSNVQKKSNITDVALKYKNKYLFSDIHKNDNFNFKNNEILRNFLDSAYFSHKKNEDSTTILKSKTIRRFKNLSINNKIKELEIIFDVNLKNKNAFKEIPKLLKNNKGINFEYSVFVKHINNKQKRYTNEMLILTLMLKNNFATHIPTINNFLFIDDNLDIKPVNNKKIKDIFEFIYFNKPIPLNKELDKDIMINFLQEFNIMSEYGKQNFLLEVLDSNMFEKTMQIRESYPLNSQINFEENLIQKIQQTKKNKNDLFSNKKINKPKLESSILNSIRSVKENIGFEYNHNSDIKPPLLKHMNLVNQEEYYDQFEIGNTHQVVNNIMNVKKDELESQYYLIFNQFQQIRETVLDSNNIDNKYKNFPHPPINTNQDMTYVKNKTLKNILYDNFKNKDVSNDLVHLFYNTKTEEEFIEKLSNNPELREEVMNLRSKKPYLYSQKNYK